LDPQADLQFEGPSAIPWAGNRHGRDGWTTFFQTVGDSLDEITLTIEPFAAQGDRVVASGRYQARVKRTGNRIDSPLAHLWTFRNGMVVRCQELTDTAAEAAACTTGVAVAG
jgi:ketosteroid isomerase-like protein